MILTRRAFALASLAGLAARPALAQGPATRVAPRTATLSDGMLTLEVRDLSPRFLVFFAAASNVTDPDQRFALWEQHYGFSATPPTPQGKAVARKLLDAAWPRYAEAVPIAEAGAAGMQPPPLPVLGRVARVLGLEKPARMQLTTFIGGFEDNAFTAGSPSLPSLALPLETAPAKRTLIMAHEGAHAIHILVGGASGGWERSVAATLVQEGLATHAAREAVPGHPLTAYLEHRPGWLAECRAKDRQILTLLKGKLARSDSDAVMSVTMGVDPAVGLDRLAYYGGYRVVEALRRQGLTLAQIARIPEADAPARVAPALDALFARA